MSSEPRPSESLWILAAAPAIWLIHFLLSYITAAIWCAKHAGADGSLGAAWAVIAAYTAVALGGLALVGRRGLRRWRLAGVASSRELDAPADRERFLARTSLLLAGLAGLAVAYAALVAVFIRSCR
jgi:hypothetical protein